MTITLEPNTLQPGTLGGSSVRQVGDTHVATGENNLSHGIPIDRAAVPGDVMVVWLATGSGQNVGGVANNMYQSPRPWVYVGRKLSGNGARQVALDLWYYRIQPGDPGGSHWLSWDYGGLSAWFKLVARIYHGHNGLHPIAAIGGGHIGYAPSSVFANSGTCWSGGMWGTLVDAALAFNADVNVGTSSMGDNATYAHADSGNDMPGGALHTGLVDLSIPYLWGGATVAFNQGSSGPVAGSAVGWSIALSPMPAPRRIAFSLAQNDGTTGNFIDLTKPGLTARLPYTPIAGQGDIAAWGIAREHSDGSHRGFWNADLNRWEPAEYHNAGDLPTNVYVFPDDSWGPNTGDQWYAYAFIIEGEQFLKSDMSTPVIFTSRDAPVVTVTAPTGNPTSTPTAVWTVNAGPSGGGWQVKYFRSAEYLAADFDPDTADPAAESGWSYGSVGSSWVPSGILAGGGHYRAYVQVARDNQLSEWGFSEFYARYDELPTPTWTATPENDPATGCPRAKLVVTGHVTDAAHSGYLFVSVWRYDAKTNSMVPLRFGTGVAMPWSPQTVTIYDYDLPPNTVVAYQARMYSTARPPVLTLDSPTLGLIDTPSNPLG